MSDELKKDEAVKKSKSPDKTKAKNVILELYSIYKAELKKIVWPSREDLVKQTITVIVISLLFGAYISLMDGILSQALQQFVNLLS